MKLVRITVENVDDLDLAKEILEVYLKNEQRYNLLPLTCQICSHQCIHHVFGGQVELDVPFELSDRMSQTYTDCSFPVCQLSAATVATLP